MKNKYNKNVIGLLSLIFIETFIVKICQFKFLPAKYFYDSNKILNMIKYNYRLGDNAYDFVADIFSKFNFLNFTNLKQWAYFLAIIFIIIIFIQLIKNKNYSTSQYLFIYASVGLLNIYIFNISKDIIQFLFFFLVFLILKNNKFKAWTKILLISLILLYESLHFRIYYAIMLMLIYTLYFIYIIFIKNKKMDKKAVLKIIILSLFTFFIEVYIIELISIKNYQAILYARYGVNSLRTNDMDAVTIINDLLGKNINYITFIGNYIINSIRMMLPIELLFKGIKYVPFIIYQVYITKEILKSIKSINNKNILYIATVLSYFMISFIFEPDFGSFIRHESAIFLILLEITKINKEGESNEKN